MNSCGLTRLLLTAFIVLLSLLQKGHPRLGMEGLPKTKFVDIGDLTIGALLPIHRDKDGSTCGDIHEEAVQSAAAIAFAVDKVNRNKSILPGIRLGFVILDDCDVLTNSLLQILSFLSSCDCNVCIGGDNEKYNVIGVTVETSMVAVPASTLLGSEGIPSMSYDATSDALTFQPNFLRLAPPDRIQAETIFKLLEHFNWTSVSVVYSYEAYGIDFYTTLKLQSNPHNVCIATAHPISRTAEPFEVDAVLKTLLARGARVVILLAIYPLSRLVFEAVDRINAQGQFIWIASDATAGGLHMVKNTSNSVVGAITVRLLSKTLPDFENHFSSLCPDIVKNPWIRELQKKRIASSVDGGVCNRMLNVDFHPYLARVMDTVTALALAADRLVFEKCPNVSGAQAAKCVQPSNMLQYLMNLKFQGLLGRNEFDRHGNILQGYQISQVLPPSQAGGPVRERPCAIFDPLTSSIRFTNTISFSHFRTRDIRYSSLRQYDHPLSLCWSKCKANEFINRTRCVTCPYLQWPDEETLFKSCRPIPPRRFSQTARQILFQTVLATVGLLWLAVIGLMYVRFRRARIIKASSRELSAGMLVGVLMGYTAILIATFSPTSTLSCGVCYFLFTANRAWVYAALLLRTRRIWLIFKSAMKGDRRVTCLIPRAQIAQFLFVVSIDGVLTAIFMRLFAFEALPVMPNQLEEYVEIRCNVNLHLHFAYLHTLVFLLPCLYLAYKVRNLADNFNESKFICMCSCTELILEAMFMPPLLLTKNKQSMLTQLWTLHIIFINSAILGFLFMPKLYAVLYFRQDGHFKSATTSAVRPH